MWRSKQTPQSLIICQWPDLSSWALTVWQNLQSSIAKIYTDVLVDASTSMCDKILVQRKHCAWCVPACPLKVGGCDPAERVCSWLCPLTDWVVTDKVIPLGGLEVQCLGHWTCNQAKWSWVRVPVGPLSSYLGQLSLPSLRDSLYT